MAYLQCVLSILVLLVHGAMCGYEYYNVSVIEGGHITLPVVFNRTGVLTLLIEWESDQGNIGYLECYDINEGNNASFCDWYNSGSKPRYSFPSNDQIITDTTINVSLTINNVSKSDEGWYYTFNYYNVGVSTYFDLTVVVPPIEGYPRCSLTPTLQILSGNDETQVMCESMGGDPEVTLSLYSRMDIIEQTIGQVNESIIITHEFASAMDGKVFTCITTQAGLESGRCDTPSLTFIKPPWVYINTHAKYTSESDMIMWCTCAVDSRLPFTQFKWYYNETEIQHGSMEDRFQILGQGEIFRIRNISLNENGVCVVCEASNEIGTAMAKVYVEFPESLSVPKSQSSTSTTSQSSGIVGGFLGGILITILCVGICFLVYFYRNGKLQSFIHKHVRKDETRNSTVTRNDGYANNKDKNIKMNIASKSEESDVSYQITDETSPEDDRYMTLTKNGTENATYEGIQEEDQSEDMYEQF